MPDPISLLALLYFLSSNEPSSVSNNDSSSPQATAKLGAILLTATFGGHMAAEVQAKF